MMFAASPFVSLFPSSSRTELGYMVKVLSAANIMNATGENSEGIEGVSEMLKGSASQLTKVSSHAPQRRNARQQGATL